MPVPNSVVYRDSSGVLRDSPPQQEGAAGGTADLGTLLSYQQLKASDLAAAVGLTVPPGATSAVVQSNGGTGVRWTPNGSPPTMSLGMRIDAGTSFTFTENLAALRFIDEGSNAVLDVAYYG